MQKLANQIVFCQPTVQFFYQPVQVLHKTIYCSSKLDTKIWKFDVTEKSKRKCAPKFTLNFNDGSKFLIPQLNASWVATIIASQGVEFRFTQSACKTNRCVLVQKPNKTPRTKRDIPQILPDMLHAGTHCASFLIYSYCPNAIDRSEVVKLGNMILGQLGTVQQDTYKFV